MKKRLIGISIVILIICSSIFIIFGSKKDLSKNQMMEDFNYLFNSIIDNYPYLDVNKRVNEVDFKANETIYRDMIKECENDDEFETAIKIIVKDLNNSHSYIFNKEVLEQFRNIYNKIPTGSWYDLNRKVLNNKKALRRYGLSREVKELEKKESAFYEKPKFKDIVNGEIGYMEIPLMNNSSYIKEDKEDILGYLESIKNYDAVVVDIRGNRGGDSNYWHYIFSNIVNRDYYTEYYSFYKDGKLINKFLNYNKNFIKPVEKLDTSNLKNLPQEVTRDFKSYSKDKYSVEKASSSINFKGKIYLLVDDKVFSSAEALAVFAKSTGMATLIGEKTKGDGIGSDPMLMMLPNSGLVFNFTKEMGTTIDGTCNEEHKTNPDIIVNNPKKTGDFKTDECIKKVLELESRNNI
ncbi:S41 family peptidase [Clostridium sardiniense]|uniref:S41 family peptidase n=1 Tax=Clostridium sardiniense TaxID=29369 RepID=UPI003D328E5B